nr:stress-induced protein 8 [Ipomoea batatas]
MAAMVDACMVQLAKLTERVQPRKLILLRARKTDSLEAVEESKAAIKESSSSSSSEAALQSPEGVNDNTMSEATVFWLMDRFAPA